LLVFSHGHGSAFFLNLCCVAQLRVTADINTIKRSNEPAFFEKNGSLESFINILNFLLMLSLGLTKDNKIMYSLPLVRGGMRLNYAYAFNRTFGLISDLIIDYGESAYRGEPSVWNYSYGLAFDANLMPKQNVPLGFLAGFMHTSIPTTREETDKQPNVFLFQFNYTGRKDLNLGLEVTFNWYKPQNFNNYLQYVTFGLNSTVYL